MKLFLVLLCYCLVRAQVPMMVSDYAGGPTEGDAWIILTTPSRDWTLHRLIWCKSIVPNDQHPDPLPHDCVGRNLLRIQLYPGGQEDVVITEPPEAAADAEENRYYVDPRRVGGWDSRHQWIMEMELQHRDAEKTSTATMIQVLRFNAIDALPVATSSPPSLPPPTPHDPSPEQSSATTTATHKEESSSTTSPTLTVDVERPWIGFLVILGAGLCFIVGGVMAYRFGNWRIRPAAMQQHSGGGYEWNRDDQLEDEEDRLRQEDLQILSKMNN